MTLRYRRLEMEKDIVVDKIAKHEKLAKEFIEEIATLFAKYNPGRQGKFIFGAFPTALDAHTISFLARLYDRTGCTSYRTVCWTM